MRYSTLVKLFLIACVLGCMIFPVHAGEITFAYEGFVSFAMQSEPGDPYFNRFDVLGSPIKGTFRFDPATVAPFMTGGYPLPVGPHAITADVFSESLGTLHFENDPAVNLDSLNSFLGLFPADYSVSPMSLLILAGLHGYYGWGIGGFSSADMWPAPLELIQDGGILVGTMGDPSVPGFFSPLNFNMGTITSFRFTPGDSDFYMIGFNITSVTGVASVPEPGTLILMGLGIAGLVWRRKRT